MIRKFLIAVVTVLLVLLGYTWIVFSPQLPVASGYAGKKMCSCTFIADREQESIQSEDLKISPLHLTSTKIDHEGKSATTSVFGWAKRTAVFRGDAGCILLQGADDYGVSFDVPDPILSDTLSWPKGRRVVLRKDHSNLDFDKLSSAVENAFDSSLKMDSAKTRAVIIVHNDEIVAEKYAHGYNADTELLGWSMTKSITATLIGILQKNDQVQIDDIALFPEWKDERRNISLKDMLQMQSGLEFSEVYDGLSDATKMLFTSENVSDIPLAKSLVYAPGTYWSYSSGTTNVLQRLIQNKIGDQSAYLHFPYDSLFHRIGMTSAVMETDESGLYIGSSYCYATPRDWAKFGLLYLNKGNWYGDQIIDSSWVDFVQKPALSSNGIYGGHFWLNVGKNNFPDAPDDIYIANGFQGQHVVIMPSQNMVVVRMGLAEHPQFKLNKLLKEIVASIKEEG